MPLPVIGITTYGRNKDGDFHLPGEYVDAVRRAGGLPILLAPGEQNVEAVFDLVDGLIFAGGGDIDPACYRGTKHAAVSRVDRERDTFELELAKLALQDTRPVLGICRGFQILNVAGGGDLEPHLPDVVGDSVAHRTPEGDVTEHTVAVDPSSRLAEVLGENPVRVVSKHHQGIRTVAPAWRGVARAEDGVVEALENPNHPWMIAVLWHPELSPGQAAQQRLFEALIRKAKK